MRSIQKCAFKRCVLGFRLLKVVDSQEDRVRAQNMKMSVTKTNRGFKQIHGGQHGPTLAKETIAFNLPTSSFQMMAYTLWLVLIAPHHHGVSESAPVDRVKQKGFKKKIEYNKEFQERDSPLLQKEKKEKRSVCPQITYCQSSLAQIGAQK